jgi:hypothetical protein
MDGMGLTDKAKQLADAALLKAGELSETAREKAPGYLDRAADFAVKAADAAADGVDRATGGRFHDKLDGASARVGEKLDRPRPSAPPTTTGKPEAPTDTTGQAGGGPSTPTAQSNTTEPDGPKRTS